MSNEETTILDFMQPGSLYARKEIARKAIRRSEYEENQHWADSPLAALVSQGLVEIDQSGYYHLPEKHKFKNS